MKFWNDFETITSLTPNSDGRWEALGEPAKSGMDLVMSDLSQLVWAKHPISSETIKYRYKFK